MKKLNTYILVMITSIFLSGCGSSGTSYNPDSPINNDKNDLSWMNQNLSNYVNMDEEYSQQPDTSKCESGLLSTSYSKKMLELVNEIRSLHRLSPLTYNYSFEKAVQDSALMMDVNNKLDHHPTADWKCYSASGSSGAGSSNLGLGYYTLGVSIVRGWLQDGGVASLGHRRWMLSPGMSQTSFGAVGRGYAMQTMGYGSSLTPEFVAYPYLDYSYDLIGPALWSFSVNDGSVYNSSVSFTDATVNISGLGDVPFTSLGGNYGSGTTISFNPRGWEPNKEYIVTIKGVKNSKQDTYSYRVKIIK